MAIKIPVFLSCPSVLNDDQQKVYEYVLKVLDQEGLQPRALGRSDFPKSSPTTEVYYIVRACFGGIILGFSQIEIKDGIFRRGTPVEKNIGALSFATPWNQIESGMLIAMDRPLLLFAEQGIEGGVFDQGASSGFLQQLCPATFDKNDREIMRERIRLWSAEVRTKFRS